MKFNLIWPVILEKKSFENVDVRTDGRRRLKND